MCRAPTLDSCEKPRLHVESRKIPGYEGGEIEVFILTPKGLTELLARYKGTLKAFIGSPQTSVFGNTLQVYSYERYNWTMFNAMEKQQRRKTVFPQEQKAAFEMGVEYMKRMLDQ